MDNHNDTKAKDKAQNVLKHFLFYNPVEYCIAAFAAAFCAAGTVGLLSAPDKKFTELVFTISAPIFLVVLLVTFALLLFLSLALKEKRVVPAALLIFSVIYGSALAYFNPDNIYFNIGIALLLFLVVTWVTKGDKMQFHTISLPKRSVWIAAGVGALLFTAVVSIASIARYESYAAHNYDFGIFTQMFENMRTTGLADTTVERNVLMSHFGVHFSPFYYVMLPLYMIVPRPETLLVIQAAAVASGIFAVVLICKKLELSKNITLAFSIIYLFFPSLANGCLYDFHENKFLTVLLLWMVYFMLSKRTKLMFLFAVLTLLVKEDAAIYIAAFALYLILSRKEYWKGLILLILSAAYFSFAVSMVSAFNTLGSGVMMDRLQNYIPQGESGFLAVVKTCFMNFGYFISQVFTAEKIAFIFWMLLPVAFVPFFHKKKSVLLLFIPMLVIDLMSNWQYQYDIDFQYTFGVAALVIVMTLMAVKEMTRRNRHTAVLLSSALCIVMTFSLTVPRMQSFVAYDNSVRTQTQMYNELIASLPKDAEVTANGFYIPHMYDFKKLYQYPYEKETEYLLISSADVTENKNGLDVNLKNNYVFQKSAGNMQLYKHKA